MGQIAAHEFISLDGVFENPGWTAEHGFPDAVGAAIGQITAPARAILLGRVTFQMFAPAWSTRTAQDDPGVPFFNDTPKHVVSGTLSSADAWQNSSVLGPYDPDAISALRASVDGDIYVSGSGTLVRALLADGLLDALHLFVFPRIHGAGQRLFVDAGDPLMLALTGHEAFDNGVVHLTYGGAGA